MKKVTLGVIVGNRGFFPDSLAKEGRSQVMKALKRAGVKAVALGLKDTKFGAVETLEEARKCGELFARNADNIDGILVTLPNFGDERGVAHAVRYSGLDVPILVQATPDDPKKMTIADRRDSFCGKISACNNLRQFGLPFSLTQNHTEALDSLEFAEDIEWFAAVCRIVRKLNGIRIGAIGSRPAAFNTVRFSEKLLEDSGISVETVDLYEIFGRCDKLRDTDQAVKKRIKAIQAYVPTKGVPSEALLKLAKFAVVVDRWMAETDCEASAIQCWTAMEEYFGIVPCAAMSMMSEKLVPSACEVDICGAVAMLALQEASGRPSALVDWNNNYDDDPDRAVVFHCSNLPKSMFADVKMDYQEIIAGSVGKENTFGTCVGRLAAGPATFARVSTDDADGIIRAYVAEGEITDDPVKSFGGYGVVVIDGLQDLLEYICRMGFEHHSAMNPGHTGRAVEEALETYFDWDVYNHNAF